MGPPCVFLVHINHKKHMVEANVAYVRHKNTYGREWHPFMCNSVVHMSPKTTTKGREKLISPSYTFPSRHLPLTTPNTPPPQHPCLVLSSLVMSCLGFSNLFLSCLHSTKDHMARTIKHVSEMSRPPRKKPPAYTYRLPLRMVESADGDIYPSGVDTLETKAHLERRDTEEAILETKRFCTVTLARESDMNSTFSASAVGCINERDRAKTLSFAMRKRVAEMHLEPPRFAVLKKHCIDVIAGLQAGMYPPDAIDNEEGIVSTSGTDAFQNNVNRKLLKLRKRYYNNRHSWTWTDHFKLHHTVWLSNYFLRVPVEALKTAAIAHDAFPGGSYQCRAHGAV